MLHSAVPDRDSLGCLKGYACRERPSKIEELTIFVSENGGMRWLQKRWALPFVIRLCAGLNRSLLLVCQFIQHNQNEFLFFAMATFPGSWRWAEAAEACAG